MVKVKVKVKCGRFSLDGIVYKTNDVVEVNDKLSSIKTLISMKDLEVIQEVKPVKETEVVEPVKETEVVEPVEETTTKKSKKKFRKQ